MQKRRKSTRKTQTPFDYVSYFRVFSSFRAIFTLQASHIQVSSINFSAFETRNLISFKKNNSIRCSFASYSTTTSYLLHLPCFSPSYDVAMMIKKMCTFLLVNGFQ